MTVDGNLEGGVLQASLQVIFVSGVRAALKIEVCMVVDLHCYIRLHAPLYLLLWDQSNVQEAPKYQLNRDAVSPLGSNRLQCPSLSTTQRRR